MGPPNFGEDPKTDSKFDAWIISVRKPILILGGVQIGGRSGSTITEIQLSIDPTKFDSGSLLPIDGKLVMATGKLWKATSQGDVTPVVLSVKKLRPTDKTICRVEAE